jgi:pimeloyl-ACP methyl ester carboxylesterase
LPLGLETGLVESLEMVRVGSGPPLLLLHGPTPVAAHLPFVELLSQHAEVVAPSHPGFGGSPRPDDFDSMYDLQRLYLDLLDELPFENVTLVGLSFGGWLAAEIAVACTHKLKRLVLVDAVGIKLGGRVERDIVHMFNTPPAELDRKSWHAPDRRPPGPFGLGWQMHLDSFRDDELVRLARSWDALCLYGWRPHLYNPHLKSWLHRIQVPTLVIWGVSDRIVTPEYGRAYSQLIPHARFEVIEGAGHHPELEQPEAFVERVVAFVRGTGG